MRDRRRIIRQCITAVLAMAALGGAGCRSAVEPSAPVAVALRVEPRPSVMAVGERVTLTVVPVDAQGGPVASLPAPTFVSSDAYVITVDAAGTITAVAPGSVTISVRVDAASGTLSTEFPVVAGVPVPL